MAHINRRTFIATTTAAAVSAPASPVMSSRTTGSPPPADDDEAPRRPVVIASGGESGRNAVTRAWELLSRGSDPLDAVVQGVKRVEDDADDMSVGLGGLPNEHGVVQLDASVMHGPTHKAGSVAALEDIQNPASVALKVCRLTDHVMLVGEGAKQFALQMGFKKTSLLTPRAREAWLRWKANLNPNDDWLDDDQQLQPTNRDSDASASTARNRSPIPYTTGTIHCAAVDSHGDISACTTTSGLSWKIPGRVGDSPIIGAGMYCDNEVGSAGATGRGEAVIHACGAFQAVQHMANGDHPDQACMKVLRWIDQHTRRPDLRDADGRLNFNVTMYAMRKDGTVGSATIQERQYAVADGAGVRLIPSPKLYD